MLCVTPVAPELAALGEQRYNARAAVPAYEDIFARWARDSAHYRARALADGACRLDVSYGAGPAEALDLFFPKGRARGTLMYIHGGYWCSLDKSDASLVAPAFVEQGYAVAVVNYALCPAVSIGFIVGQMRAAARWLARHSADWGAPAGTLHACGHSAGGHLAAMLLASPASLAPVASAIGISGLYDLRPLLTVPSVLRMTALETPDAQANSPVLLQAQTHTALLTAWGVDENQGFIDQAFLVEAAWEDRHAGHVACPGRHHFSILDELISAEGRIFKAAMRLMTAHAPVAP